MSTTYKDLVTNIKAISARTDTATINAIPQFIAAAQTTLDSELRVAAMLKILNFPAESHTVGVIDALQIETVIVGDFEGTLTTIADVYKSRKGLNPAGDLTKYSINGNVIELVAPQEVRLYVYERPLRLSDSRQANAYTEAAENALLWLAMSNLCLFTKDPDGVQAWRGLAMGEIETLNDAHEAYKASGTLGVISNEF